MSLMNRGMTVGLGFILVPIVILVGYLSYHWLSPMDYTVGKSAVDIAIAAPTHPTAQVLIGAGTCFMSICYGIAKIIREIRRA